MTVRRAVAVLAGALVVVYGVFGADVTRWGCPSQEELERPYASVEVVDAFAAAGVPLERIPWPPELRRARSYRGAVVYRHKDAAASLSLVVCKVRCELSRFQLRPGKPRRRTQFGVSMVNVGAWVDAPDRGSAVPLRAALGRGVDRLNRAPDPVSRCYVN